MAEGTPPVQEINFNYTDNNAMNPRCLCDNTGCPRHGNCRLCTEFHRITAHPSTCHYDWRWRKGSAPERTVLRYSEQKK